jgi:8-oxo-dGTP pyrophosphatase MutT (NUDIX family)
MPLPPEALHKAMRVVLRDLPIVGRIERIGLVEISPQGSSYVGVYPFAGNAAADTEYAAPYVKVTAFVTREGHKGRELLVFRHPTAGVQLPAGSVEQGESPETAALREVAEETGLADIRVVSNLGVRIYPLPDMGRIVARETMVYPDPKITSDGTFVRRGLTVHEIGRTEKFSQIEFREYSVRDATLQIDKIVFIGWVPVGDLSPIMERHFFQIEVLPSTPDEWTWFAEGEHDFACYWVPILEDPGLVSGQDKWLSWFVGDLF